MGWEAREPEGRGQRVEGNMGAGCSLRKELRTPQERLKPYTPFPPRLACMCLHRHICLRFPVQPPSLNIRGYNSHTIKLTL